MAYGIGLGLIGKGSFLRGREKEEEFLLEGFKYRIGCCERLKITYHMD